MTADETVICSRDRSTWSALVLARLCTARRGKVRSAPVEGDKRETSTTD